MACKKQRNALGVEFFLGEDIAAFLNVNEKTD